jgi:hypothetical protein
MIFVDTSNWIDHLHAADPLVIELLDRGEITTHPMVIGELALASVRNRAVLLDSLAGLPSIAAASHSEVMHLVDKRELYGEGVSLVDAHLLASTILTPGNTMWARDKRLREASAKVGLNFR